MGCSATVFVDQFSNFSTFSVLLLVLGRPERPSFTTDTRPAFKHECHSKTLVRLKEYSPKALRSISRFLVANLPIFTQNLMQTRCSILPLIADKMKHEFEKALVYKNACSQRGATWQTNAIGSRKCDLGLPSHLLSPRQLQQ
jgi:hypothetical protein